ncbi:membrane protein [Marinicella pacifica]|jgi:LemA protein|uniref:Membrane protein n=2 Tax=Marinicella pacifica TaxID=1171543 RepID=A0A917CDS2_9GAMM|nr:membrane protein [Marinicella pacifica]
MGYLSGEFMRTMSVLIILGLVVAAVVVWAVGLYNQLVKKKNHVEDGWSGIDVQLKRRYDLIPNLVKVVQQYAQHEEQTLKKVIQLRNQAKQADNPSQQIQQEQKLSQALSGLMVQVEAYPDLKANTNFLDLQQQLQQIETDIQYARRYYNGAVREYNTLVQSFPSNIIAQKYDFREAEYFEIEDPVHAENPDIAFD